MGIYVSLFLCGKRKERGIRVWRGSLKWLKQLQLRGRVGMGKEGNNKFGGGDGYNPLGMEERRKDEEGWDGKNESDGLGGQRY